MIISIIGPPSSGKGTLARELSKKLNYQVITTSDLLKKRAEKDENFRKIWEETLKEGKLMPTELVSEIIENEIKGKQNLILDGSPRTLYEANVLKDYIDVVIFIKVHKEILIEKMKNRLVCPKCGRSYNTLNLKKEIEGIKYELPPVLPKEDMLCDNCKVKLIKRIEDEEKIFEKRLKEYEKHTLPIIQFYKCLNKKIIEIWYNLPVEKIVDKVINEIFK